MIRKATTADIPLIRKLAEATWEPTYRNILSTDQIRFMFTQMYSEAALERQLTELGHTFFLLYQQQEPAGFAAASPLPGQPVLWKLHKLYVLPERQGTGAGRALLQAVEREAAAAGAHTLRLNVNRHNPAQHFYQRQGFQILEEVDVPIGDYWMNDYVMEKPRQA